MHGATQSISGLWNIIIRRNALRLLSPYGVPLTRVLYVQSGGGLVADSVPASEWTETQNKARAGLRAAEMVLAGLDNADETGNGI